MRKSTAKYFAEQAYRSCVTRGLRSFPFKTRDGVPGIARVNVTDRTVTVETVEPSCHIIAIQKSWMQF